MSERVPWARSGKPALARALFAHDVDVAEVDPSEGDFPLFPEEEAQIARAVEVRRSEYAAARHLYRALTADRGGPRPLLNGADRAPIWPDGHIGSITHTRGYCAVVLARGTRVAALGIDAEPDAALERPMWRAVTTADERSALEALESSDPTHAGALARVVFSAKESAYKAQYTLTREFLGFDAMRIALVDSVATSESGAFVATLTRDVGDRFCAGDAFAGRFVRGGGVLVTGVTIPREYLR